MTAQQNLVDVLLPLAVPQAFTYAVPAGVSLQRGQLVEVPVGGRKEIGAVWTLDPVPPAATITIKAISKVFDLPPLAETLMQLIEKTARYYIEPLGVMLRLCLRASSVFEDLQGAKAYRKSEATPPQKLTAQRQRVLEFLSSGQAFRLGEICEHAGVTASVVQGLVKLGLIEEAALPRHLKFKAPNLDGRVLELSLEQQQAAAIIEEKIQALESASLILDGVTGSGKTEVYFEAIESALKASETAQTLLLLPEIALTTAFIKRAERRFGAEPCLWHSGLSERDRERNWLAVAKGEARLVLGARSALFLPYQNLRLIVVDEEHETAYKQEDGANYHARDVAVLYGALGKFPVVLASATPSLESLVNADRGRYQIVQLKDRHGKRPLPQTKLIDLRLEKLETGRWISEPLKQAVAESLNTGQQALLFLNRRGFAPLTLCRRCGFKIECPECSVAMVAHKFKDQMLCHQCGHQQQAPKLCPQCGDAESLVPVGPGIERLSAEAKQLFPEARMTVLSSDLLRGKALFENLAAIERGDFNLILGTQLIAKGHHFPLLGFVGVVDADLALENSDPRAAERSFALISQVAGRAGRGAFEGRAMVQSYLPEHPLMKALEAGERDAFLQAEKSLRETAQLPPYVQFSALIISAPQQRQAEMAAKQLRQCFLDVEGISVLGPAPAPLFVLRNRYRFRILIRSQRNIHVQNYIADALQNFQTKGAVKIEIDIDPYNFL